MAGRRDVKRELFEEHALPHLDALYCAALHLTRDQQDAQDLLQETMLRGYRFFEQFTPGTNCRAWLMTILYNAFRNAWRQRGREQVSNSSEEFEHNAETNRDPDRPSDDPEATLAGRVLDHEIADALKSLPDEFRVVLLMIDIEELSYKEAANVLGVPVGTVRSRLSRGRGLLREALREFAETRGYLKSRKSG